MKTSVPLPLDTLPSFVTNHLTPLLKTMRIFTLSGPLGAGKTTLTKEFLRQCGISATITSPTFSYVNTYTNAAGCTFYHFDLYRLGAVEEFIAMGFDEYLNTPDAYCLIEWPEVITSLLVSYEAVCRITLDHRLEEDFTRFITID